jgi:hypothetical protein
MIKSIYVMDENGLLLYSKNFMEEQYEQDILIGFFASIANFSREALGSIVKNVDLGKNNKLILYPSTEQRLLGAVIVSSNDNNELVMAILKNIIQDFIDSYAPDYNIDQILEEDMEQILNSNMKNQILRSPIRRLVLSWLLVAPLSPLLILLSITVTIFIYDIYDLNRFLTPELLFIRFMPILVLLSTINIIILFLGPNMILGYLSPNWKIAVVNSIIFLVGTITLYFYSSQPNFAYIVIGNLPLSLIFSLFFLFIGIRYSSKKFLKK